MPMAPVDDRAAHDGTDLFDPQGGSDSAGMAHQGIARQFTQLLAIQHHVTQRSQAGVDAIVGSAGIRHLLDHLAGPLDACPATLIQRQLMFMAGDGDDLQPAGGCI